MTDRELLELAAKAAGIEINASKQAARDASGHGNVGLGLWTTTTTNWDPLTDDGDALRLVATLRLEVKPGKHVGDGCTVETQRGITGCTAFHTGDPSKQMRRAIVIAAANIGKAMP